MKFTNQGRKNFVIFSLVLLLGLIGYINFSLNKQALLQTSSEFERYELTMMQQSGVIEDIVDESVFSEKGGVEVVEVEFDDGQEASKPEREMNNAIIVDSAEVDINELAQETSTEIAKVITNKQAMRSNTYFIESKLERDKKRSEMVSNLNEMINNQLTSEEIRKQAQSMKLQTISNMEKEVFIENMIMAKGFNDVIVYLTDQSINVVVNSEGLTEKDVAIIVDIVRRETSIAMDNIIIMNKK